MKILQIDVEWNDDGVSPTFEARVLDRSGNPHYNVTGERIVDVLRELIDREAESGFQSRQSFVAMPQAADASGEGEECHHNRTYHTCFECKAADASGEGES